MEWEDVTEAADIPCSLSVRVFTVVTVVINDFCYVVSNRIPIIVVNIVVIVSIKKSPASTSKTHSTLFS